MRQSTAAQDWLVPQACVDNLLRMPGHAQLKTHKRGEPERMRQQWSAKKECNHPKMVHHLTWNGFASQHIYSPRE